MYTTVLIYRDQNDVIRFAHEELLKTRQDQFLKIRMDGDSVIISKTDTILIGHDRVAFFTSVSDGRLQGFLKSLLFYFETSYMLLVEDEAGDFVSAAADIGTIEKEFPEEYQKIGEKPEIRISSYETIDIFIPAFVISSSDIDEESEYRQNDQIFQAAYSLVRKDVKGLSETLDSEQKQALDQLLSDAYWLLEVSCYFENSMGVGFGQEAALRVMEEKLGLKKEIDQPPLQ